MKKNLISITDLKKTEIESLFKTAKAFKKDPFSKASALKSKSIALVFQKPSNRTRFPLRWGWLTSGATLLTWGRKS